jgi:hypothetical protein
MRQFLDVMKRERDRRSMETVCTLMLDSFGGVEGFFRVWDDYYNRSMKQGGAPAMRCLKAMLALARHGG